MASTPTPVTEFDPGPLNGDNGFPVFNSSGQLLGNLTGNQGQTPAPSFSLPSFTGETLPSPIGGGAGSPGVASAANASGVSGAPPTATTGNANAATGQGTANNWFARATIVILGFVFVAVGLSQFGRGQMIIKAAIGKVPK